MNEWRDGLLSHASHPSLDTCNYGLFGFRVFFSLTAPSTFLFERRSSSTKVLKAFFLFFNLLLLRHFHAHHDDTDMNGGDREQMVASKGRSFLQPEGGGGWWWSSSSSSWSYSSSFDRKTGTPFIISSSRVLPPSLLQNIGRSVYSRDKTWEEKRGERRSTRNDPHGRSTRVMNAFSVAEEVVWGKEVLQSKTKLEPQRCNCIEFAFLSHKESIEALQSRLVIAKKKRTEFPSLSGVVEEEGVGVTSLMTNMGRSVSKTRLGRTSRAHNMLSILQKWFLTKREDTHFGVSVKSEEHSFTVVITPSSLQCMYSSRTSPTDFRDRQSKEKVLRQTWWTIQLFKNHLKNLLFHSRRFSTEWRRERVKVGLFKFLEELSERKTCRPFKWMKVVYLLLYHLLDKWCFITDSSFLFLCRNRVRLTTMTVTLSSSRKGRRRLLRENTPPFLPTEEKSSWSQEELKCQPRLLIFLFSIPLRTTLYST